MVRLYLFAEGQTERTFTDTVLKQHLATTGVFLQGVAALIGLAAIRAKCPHFHAWLSRLETLSVDTPP